MPGKPKIRLKCNNLFPSSDFCCHSFYVLWFEFCFTSNDNGKARGLGWGRDLVTSSLQGRAPSQEVLYIWPPLLSETFSFSFLYHRLEKINNVFNTKLEFPRYNRKILQVAKKKKKNHSRYNWHEINCIYLKYTIW